MNSGNGRRIKAVISRRKPRTSYYVQVPVGFRFDYERSGEFSHHRFRTMITVVAIILVVVLGSAVIVFGLAR